MPDNNGPDSIDQIKELPDAADDTVTWMFNTSHEVPEWNLPSPGTMTAVLLDMSRLTFVEISQHDPGADLARLVGDPFFDSIRHLRATTFWVGGNSVANAPFNQAATQFLRRLLSDVRDGAYVASDLERRHAHRLLAHRDRVPLIQGPCLITGVNAHGEPGPLSENFQNWLASLIEAAHRSHISAAFPTTRRRPPSP